jgi:Nod factor-specific ABC transporter NodJ protein
MKVKPLLAIILRETLIFKRRASKQIMSFCVSPLLYMVTFGWAFREKLTIEGLPYITFMIPGLVAMSCMRQSFGISTEINISRFYWKIFDEIRTSPVTDISYTAGEVISGSLKGILSGVIVILMAFIFNVSFSMNILFLISMVVHTCLFASLAVITAMIVKTHAEQGMLNNFVITPMAFLCGTFFPIEEYPVWVQKIINLLPLTHASNCIRASMLGRDFPYYSLIYQAVLAIILFVIASRIIQMTKK